MIFVSGDILEGTELLETIHKANVSNFYNIYDLIKDLVDKNIITIDEDELICGKGINGFIYETDGLTEDVIADAISSMYGSILYSNDADRLESTLQMFEFLSNYAENELLVKMQAEQDEYRAQNKATDSRDNEELNEEDAAKVKAAVEAQNKDNKKEKSKKVKKDDE
jgi:hypothetical protein